MSPPLAVRRLPFAVADGPTNMAADETMLVSAEKTGVVSLRFYGWAPATASLGYFQPTSVRNDDPHLAAMPFVRRASGGATLVHDRELTYALALPADPQWRGGEPWMARMHRIVGEALVGFGVHATPVRDRPEMHGDVLCFQQHAVGDLVCAGAKVVGSAQRKLRRCLLQHGAVLLGRSPHAPALPGVEDLSPATLPLAELQHAIEAGFARDTGWTLTPADWTDAERTQIATLVREKYGHASWNEKR